jgi:hypothetical protein
MLIVRKRKASLFVDRSTRNWVVQDPEGALWIIRAIEEAWEHREPYVPADETELEPVPDHYKSLLGVPD